MAELHEMTEKAKPAVLRRGDPLFEEIEKNFVNLFKLQRPTYEETILSLRLANEIFAKFQVRLTLDTHDLLLAKTH